VAERLAAAGARAQAGGEAAGGAEAAAHTLGDLRQAAVQATAGPLLDLVPCGAERAGALAEAETALSCQAAALRTGTEALARPLSEAVSQACGAPADIVAEALQGLEGLPQELRRLASTAVSGSAGGCLAGCAAWGVHRAAARVEALAKEATAISAEFSGLQEQLGGTGSELKRALAAFADGGAAAAAEALQALLEACAGGLEGLLSAGAGTGGPPARGAAAALAALSPALDGLQTAQAALRSLCDAASRAIQRLAKFIAHAPDTVANSLTPTPCWRQAASRESWPASVKDFAEKLAGLGTLVKPMPGALQQAAQCLGDLPTAELRSTVAACLAASEGLTDQLALAREAAGAAVAGRAALAELGAKSGCAAEACTALARDASGALGQLAEAVEELPAAAAEAVERLASLPQEAQRLAEALQQGGLQGADLGPMERATDLGRLDQGLNGLGGAVRGLTAALEASRACSASLEELRGQALSPGAGLCPGTPAAAAVQVPLDALRALSMQPLMDALAAAVEAAEGLEEAVAAATGPVKERAEAASAQLATVREQLKAAEEAFSWMHRSSTISTADGLGAVVGQILQSPKARR